MIKQSWNLYKLAARSAHVYSNTIYLVLLELVSILGLYKLNSVYGVLYKAIEHRDPQQIWSSIGLFSLYAAILVVVNGYMQFIANKLAFEIRTGVTNHYLHNMPTGVDNLGQRIQEDLKRFGEFSVDFWTNLFRAVIKLPVFLLVIIHLTQWWVGLIIVVSVLLGTYATQLVARRLIPLQAIQESNEANFRSRLTYLTYLSIFKKFHQLNKLYKYLSYVQSGIGQAFSLMPFILLMPLYIAGQVDQGGFFQSVDALRRVIDSLSILIDNRQMIVNIGTCLTRLQQLDSSQKEQLEATNT